MAQHRAAIITISFIIVYCLWMDITLYYHIQRIQINPKPSDDPGGTSNFVAHSLDQNQMFSPFRGLSVKLIMMDQTNNYFFNPLAEAFEETTNFSSTFTFITPNMISAAGVLCAIAAAKMVIQDSLGYHRLAVLIFQLRNFFDALDGIVARNRLGIHFHLSVRKTNGFYADAVADTIGFVVFLYACYVYLRKNLPKRYSQTYSPLQMGNGDQESGNCNCLTNSTVHAKGSNCVSGESAFTKIPTNLLSFKKQIVILCNSRNVSFVVFCFLAQLGITSLGWNRYIEQYHQLLEMPVSSLRQATRQNEILHSSMTWVIMWFWRISCGHSIMQMLLVSIFIGRLWDFLTWIQFVGIVELLVLSLFTEIHLHQSCQYLLNDVASSNN